MKNKQKTFKVEVLKNWVNAMLANSVDDDIRCPQYRYALCTLLEDMLQETGNYKGYWSLRPNEVPEGQKAGIIFDDSPEGNHIYPDDSRRHYF